MRNIGVTIIVKRQEHKSPSPSPIISLSHPNPCQIHDPRPRQPISTQKAATNCQVLFLRHIGWCRELPGATTIPTVPIAKFCFLGTSVGAANCREPHQFSLFQLPNFVSSAHRLVPRIAGSHNNTHCTNCQVLFPRHIGWCRELPGATTIPTVPIAKFCFLGTSVGAANCREPQQFPLYQLPNFVSSAHRLVPRIARSHNNSHCTNCQILFPRHIGWCRELPGATTIPTIPIAKFCFLGTSVGAANCREPQQFPLYQLPNFVSSARRLVPRIAGNHNNSHCTNCQVLFPRHIGWCRELP